MEFMTIFRSRSSNSKYIQPAREKVSEYANCQCHCRGSAKATQYTRNTKKSPHSYVCLLILHNSAQRELYYRTCFYVRRNFNVHFL